VQHRGHAPLAQPADHRITADGRGKAGRPLHHQGGFAGNDIGSSYRSAIFYHSDEQKQIAGEIITEITDEGIYSDPVVTEVAEFDTFWPAENYHQEYFANNPNQPYCAAVVAPKVAKFRQKFVNRLKK
jgi:peptide-methionine (S)-S-oxide reductase